MALADIHNPVWFLVPAPAHCLVPELFSNTPGLSCCRAFVLAVPFPATLWSGSLSASSLGSNVIFLERHSLMPYGNLAKAPDRQPWPCSLQRCRFSKAGTTIVWRLRIQASALGIRNLTAELLPESGYTLFLGTHMVRRLRVWSPQFWNHVYPPAALFHFSLVVCKLEPRHVIFLAH